MDHDFNPMSPNDVLLALTKDLFSPASIPVPISNPKVKNGPEASTSKEESSKDSSSQKNTSFIEEFDENEALSALKDAPKTPFIASGNLDDDEGQEKTENDPQKTTKRGRKLKKPEKIGTFVGNSDENELEEGEIPKIKKKKKPGRKPKIVYDENGMPRVFKKKGRPKGAKNKNPEEREAKEVELDESGQPIKPKKGRPKKPRLEREDPELDENGQPIKKRRGRKRKKILDPNAPVKSKRFKNPAGMGRRRAKCQICGKEFIHGGHLNEHMTKHTGEKPFNCKHCGKAFRRRDHCKKHENTHTGDKPYECTICGQKFTQDGSLLQHKKRHYKQGEGGENDVIVREKLLQRQRNPNPKPRLSQSSSDDRQQPSTGASTSNGLPQRSSASLIAIERSSSTYQPQLDTLQGPSYTAQHLKVVENRINALPHESQQRIRMFIDQILYAEESGNRNYYLGGIQDPSFGFRALNGMVIQQQQPQPSVSQPQQQATIFNSLPTSATTQALPTGFIRQVQQPTRMYIMDMSYQNYG